jgi:VCBS repeat-containing protein
MKNLFQLLLTGLMIMTLANCGGGGGSLFTLATSDSFDDGDLDYNPKMDILMVVDPSKSMFEEVEKVRNNISVFIEGFIALGYEYRMGVISTSAWSDEAYLTDPVNLNFLYNSGEPVFARLHKGECVDKSGADALLPALALGYLDPLNSANLGAFLTQFSKNFDVYGVQLNTSGCGLVGPPFGSYGEVVNNFFQDSNGYDTNTRQRVWEYINDERPLQSVRAFIERDLVKPVNDRFLRADAHLAIIIVSDEPDASRDSLTPNLTFQPNAPGNHTAQDYIDYLTVVKGSIANFSIYSIVDSSFPVNISKDIATMSGGLSFDINATQAEYITNLNQISQAILVSSSFFPIAYKPIPSTIEIQIIKANGSIVNVPKDAGSGGFTYISAQQGVTLSVDYLPASGDSLKINYIPAVLINGVSDQPRLSLSSLAIPENSPDTTVLGTVSLLYGDATGGTYAITSSNPVGAYAIDGTTGVITVADSSKFDSEQQGKHQINLSLSVPGVVDAYTKTVLISITDVADSIPVAADDSYTVSETIVDGSGNITVNGNLTFNDYDIDSSEAHTWALSGGNPALGTLTINANGTFQYVVAAASLKGGSGLDAGDEEDITFSYNITDAGTNVSNTASVLIKITGFNQPPELYNPILDQTVSFLGGLVKIPIVSGDVTASGFASGSAANLVDGAAGTSATTSSAGAHWVQLTFPASSIWEVDRFEMDSNQSLGNAIFQIKAPGTGQVITREVLPVTAGTDLTVTMGSKVIGGSVKILRPVGSLNSAGNQNLQLSEISVYGIEAQSFTIDLLAHFQDLDPGDSLTFYVTDPYGEGPAPGWISVVGTDLVGIPPSGANTNVGIIAQDTSGATAFTVFNITRTGSGSGASNGPPIAVLPLDDEKRGGISLKRFGGRRETSPGVYVDCTSANNNCETASNPLTDNAIRHGEGDNFLVNPYAGEAIRDALVGQTPNRLDAATYQTSTNIPLVIRDALTLAGHANQIPHFGDNYGSENGWVITPVYTDSKYPTASATFCNQSVTANGRINPCIRDMRAYGDTYTGYFVPAQTGVYRFRSSTPVDDMVRLLMAPTEYVEDLTPVITSNHTGVQNIANSIYNNLGDSYAANQEFSPNSHPAAGHNTSMFYDGPVTINQGSYRKGYLYLKQGNVYAFEIRFQEGGGAVQFSFEYDRKDITCNPTNSVTTSPGACWDGWAAIDASVLVPNDGPDAHVPQVITAPSNAVSVDVTTMFYDAEQDILDYTARLVNPDGTPFVGPGSTSDVSEIGLGMNAQTGMLVGTLNTNYDAANPKPRIIFTVTERFTPTQAQTSSLPIKFVVP